MERLLRFRPSPAMVVACAALFISLGGVGYAAIVLPANSVGTKQLKKNAVNSAKVKRHSLLRSDFRKGQLPRGPQGIQGIPGIPGAPGAPGAKGNPGTPAIKLWAYVNYTGALRGGSGVVASSRISQGYFSVTFNQSIVNCAAIASYQRENADVSYNVSNHFAITRYNTSVFRIYVWNSILNQQLDLPFALLVAC
jgi:hypothetical protein